MSDMPSWLQAPSLPTPPDCPGNREALIALERQSFEIAFELALESLADGRALKEFCTHYHTPLSSVRFRSWIFKDSRRRKAYEVAKAIGAEQIEDELMRISDGMDANGNPSASDVARSTLQVNVRKWLLTIWNREKYGEIKRLDARVDQTVRSIDSLNAVELNEKIIEIFGLDGLIESDETE